MTMASNVILFICLVAFCGFINQVYGDDDDCGADLDLSLTNFSFVFTEEDVVVRWNLRTPTECAVDYHVTIIDSERGTIVDVYVETAFIQLEAMSPCITYNVSFAAVNKAIPTPEGPAMSTSIQFFSRVQTIPLLKSLDVGTTFINMTWLLEGEKNRCPLKNFYVNGGNVFNFTIPLEDLVDPSTVAVVIDSLQPNTMYYFQVSVENTAGYSPFSQAGVQTLPE